MVWFQCEDCGENLKKPKLPNHFRICSAFKLSCIDCGVTFGQESVQGHNQCISEAEKYGPKGQGKANTPAKANNQAKQKPDVDINVGLSSHPPWFCSLCNTNATSKQTLLLHADGKKHRAKARAYHASKQTPKPAEESTPNTADSAGNTPKEASLPNTDAKEVKEQNPPQDALNNSSIEANGKVSSEKKRKHDASDNGVASKKEDSDNSLDSSNGVVIQAKRKKTEEQDGSVKETENSMDKTGRAEEAGSKKIKWKKIITKILKTEGALDKRKLRTLVLRTVRESYTAESEADPNLKETFMHKIASSSKFTIDEGKIIRLAAKN